MFLEVWGIRHFHKDCLVPLLSKDGDKQDQPLSDITPMIGNMSHTFTLSTPINDLTFKGILKELVISAISNEKPFDQNHKYTKKYQSPFYE